MRTLNGLFHPVTIIILVILMVLYFNRDAVFPEAAESQEVKQLLTRVDSVVEQMAEGGEQPFAGEGERGFSASSPQPPESTSESLDTLRQRQAVDAGKVDAGERPGAAAGDAQDAETERPPAAVEPMTVWEAARRAAWYGDMPRALAGYRRLIAMQPDNYDAHGELGNILLHMGDVRGAADAYAKAAVLLQRYGHRGAAWQVMELVSRLDQAKARQLYQQLYGAPAARQGALSPQ